jgi:hypothetical protein|tara:strand:+ start:382 stop:492 length:111 start_codon:yes stop_codon:yes gene_type:complete
LEKKSEEIEYVKRINQEAEDLVKEEAKRKSDYFLRM